MPPYLKGQSYTNPGQSTTLLTVSPGTSIYPGDWMIMVLETLNNTNITDPSGWTILQSDSIAGTLGVSIYAKNYVASDTSYSITVDGNGNTSSLLLFWGSGADVIANWQIGSNMLRANITPPTTYNNVAPSITTTTTNNLVLIISSERTIATETDVTSVSGATEWYFAQQTGVQYETAMIATISQTGPGPTGDVTIVYPNTQSANGMALQIGLPPSVNLIANQSIQQAANASLFGVGNATLTNDTTVFMQSGSSIRVTPSGTGVFPYWYGATPTQWAPVTPGSTYTAIASLLTTTATFQFHVVFLWYNAASTYLSSTAGSPVSITTSTWGQCTLTANAPAGAAYAVVQVQADNSMNATDIFNVDEYGILNGANNSWNLTSSLIPVFLFRA